MEDYAFSVLVKIHAVDYLKAKNLLIKALEEITEEFSIANFAVIARQGNAIDLTRD